MIRLVDVNADNLREICKLAVGPGQENFVTSNAFSIAQSKYETHLIPLAIHADDVLVGFALVERDPKTGEDWITRLMIDAAHQGKGLGRAASIALVARLRDEPDTRGIWLSVVPENSAARALYVKIGFVATGKVEDGELVMQLGPSVEPGGES